MGIWQQKKCEMSFKYKLGFYHMLALFQSSIYYASGTAFFSFVRSSSYVTITINLCCSSFWRFPNNSMNIFDWRQFKSMSSAQRKKAKHKFINSNWILIPFYEFTPKHHSFETLQIPKAWSHFRTPWFLSFAFHFRHMNHIGIHFTYPLKREKKPFNFEPLNDEGNKRNIIVYCGVFKSTALAAELKHWIN